MQSKYFAVGLKVMREFMLAGHVTIFVSQCQCVFSSKFLAENSITGSALSCARASIRELMVIFIEY